MPGQICAVASCSSNRLTLKKEGVNVIFHSFPKAGDLVSSKMRKEWINWCKRQDKFNPSTSTICSLHFRPNDYERDLQNELLGLPLRRFLKKTAVPTYNPSEKPKETPIQGTPRAKRAGKNINKDLVESLIGETSILCNDPMSVPSTSTAEPSSDTEISDEPSTFTIPTPDACKKKYEDLFVRYNQLKSKTNKKMKRLNIMLK